MYGGPASDRRILELIKSAEQAYRQVVAHPRAERLASLTRGLEPLRGEPVRAWLRRQFAVVKRWLGKHP